MVTLDEYMNSPEGIAFRREIAEQEAFMKATSFTYRHGTAFLLTSFLMIIAMFGGLGYFMANGNAGSHPELFSLTLLFGFAGLALLIFTFIRMSGTSLLRTITTVIGYFGFCLVLTALSRLIASIIFG